MQCCTNHKSKPGMFGIAGLSIQESKKVGGGGGGPSAPHGSKVITLLYFLVI